MVFPDPEWLSILRAEVEKPGATISGVAAEIGMKRTALSMLLAGKYPAKLDKISTKYASAVLSRYRDQIFCPHQNCGIGADVCRGLASAPMSTSNPVKMRQSVACRRCANNPLTNPKGQQHD